MSVRQRLNAFFFLTVVLVAGLVGLVLSSWGAFAVTSFILLGLALHAGDIRMTGPDSSRHRRRSRRGR